MIGQVRGVVRAVTRGVDLAAAARAGVVSVVAYTAVMEVDRRLTGSRIDDLILLGRPAVPNRPDLARRVGAGIHLVNGAVIGVAYATLAHDRLPGPPWLRGVMALMVENLALYPTMRPLRTLHPAIRDGQLDDYWSWPAFVESLPPHIVYGALIGPLYERFRTATPGRRPVGDS
ncbi:MAG: hypothetical protein AVDCRST_MAG33-1773 [uncultured Thermomicrobiales bacterium]|uniref:Uncharacterized protein n=1 Tax=uncultured Thermomicrobiales bacterium TaxID=1645740 RepID=A0A6J4UZD3_9BACT|nr:MAG: hypothetical protein AVDCRST_MAG33-1773 [uncultured Thermomicrobiales bacterium]